MEACKHHIPMRDSCPWCERKGVAGFPITKPFQFYQGHFTEFVHEMADDDSQGPLALVIIAEDGNGQTYMHTKGPDEAVRSLLHAALSSRNNWAVNQPPEGRPCFTHRLKSGLKKLFG